MKIVEKVLDVDGAEDSVETSGSWRKRPGGAQVVTMQQMQLKHHQRNDSGDEETCRFPKLQECAHFHYERVQLCPLQISLQINNGDISIHSLQHTNRGGSDENSEDEWYTVQVTSSDECWLLQRTLENFIKLDSQLHQCIFDRKVSQLPELTHQIPTETITDILSKYLERFSQIIDNSLNCGPVLTWFQLDNRGHRLLVPNEESDSINTPAVAAAYSIKKYVSQARDELNLEVGDMISVIDMASPGESMWWRGKRGFQVGFFPQHCVHVIGEKLACLPQAPNALGCASGTVSPIKPVLRKHGKLIAFFRSFILNRPSRRRLKQSGILRERVFGCDLGEHLLNSGNEIPMVLKCCAEFIESHGVVDGIYRLSGVTSNIQKLRNAFDEDRIPNLYTEDILQDIHSVASLLKMYFRELPNPLCTYQLYHSFVNAVQGTQINSNGEQVKVDENERLLRMRETVHKLPPPHYRTLEYLMRHLAKVAKHGERTGMTTRNVAIVWAPNLLRCAELEVGGVAALQGVGVQAVVTEFLICYTDLIFCDNLPSMESNSDAMTNSSLSPKKLRPKSLALSTPTRLLSLEEARSKHLLSHKPDESSYIEVGGGPKNLPEKYHTVLELPHGFRKRSLSKRSPLGWRSFFTKSRNTSHNNLSKNVTRKASTPGMNTSFQEKSVTESDLTEIRRKLRPVKSAESLTSGQAEIPTTEIDTLGPLHCLNKPSGHNRSVSHDSYFDTLQASNNNSEGSLLDLSEIQLNFELEESEMRIFSEDESLVSSPRVNKEGVTRKVLHRARPEDINSTANSSNPSPKKQPRVVLSPENQSRKRSRLEDQLSDILYIDCNTPENLICTQAIVHTHPERTPTKTSIILDETEPKNKSPRNSNELSAKSIDIINTPNGIKTDTVQKKNENQKLKNRNSLNLENYSKPIDPKLPKSLTELNLKQTLEIPYDNNVGSEVSSTNLSPLTPNYNPLIGEGDSSEDETTPNQVSPDFSLTESPAEISYKILNRISGESQTKEFEEELNVDKENLEISNTYENFTNELIDKTSPKKSAPTSPCYENVLTTISITYSSSNSPSKSKNFDDKKKDSNIYEDIEIQPELKTTVPTSIANLPTDEASQPEVVYRTKVTNIDEVLAEQKVKSSISSNVQEQNSLNSNSPTKSPVRPTSLPFSPTEAKLVNINYVSPVRPISLSFQANNYVESPSKFDDKLLYENIENSTSTDVESTSSVNLLVNTSDENLIANSNNSLSSESYPASPSRPLSLNEKRKSCETEGCMDEDTIYQQVKYFRRSIHEINELLDKPLTVSSSPDISIASETERSSLNDQTVKTKIKVPENKDSNIADNNILDKDEEPSANEVCDSKHVSVVDVCVKNNKLIEYEEQCKVSDMISSETDTDNLESMSDRFDSLEMDSSKSDVDSIKTNVKCNEKEEISSPVSKTSPESCLVKAIIEKSPVREINLRKRTESVREIASKFENLDSSSSDSINQVNVRLKERDISSRDSLPPCLRARYAKLTKNNSKTRSLDENEFIREFCSNNSSSVTNLNSFVTSSRRKSFDERTDRSISTAQPKILNPPKILPDAAKKSPDFHSLHTFPSSRKNYSHESLTTCSLPTKLHASKENNSNILKATNLNSVQKNNKNTKESHEIEVQNLDLLFSTNNSDSVDANPQLNRERIEKYKEERRNFLREKYRSESFKAEKDQILTRLKQKIKPRTDSGDEKESELLKDSLESTDVLEIASKIDSHDSFVRHRHNIENNVLSERNQNELNPCRLNKTNLRAKDPMTNSQFANLRHNEQYESQINQRIKKIESLEDEFKKTRIIHENFDKKYSKIGDSVKLRSTIASEQSTIWDTRTNIEKGVKKKDFFDGGIKSVNRREKLDDVISSSGTADEFRRHTFDTLLARERETEHEREKRISLESKLLTRSPKREKRSPSYIKDMTAMFESKSTK